MKAVEKRAGVSTGGQLGLGRQFAWWATEREVDMARPAPAPVPVTIASAPQNVTVDLLRTAVIVVDMQNDFCAPGGWVDHLGSDFRPDRKPIEPLQRLLPALRQAGVPVIWVNWGNRPDLANMPPNQIHLYKPAGVGVGLGDPLPGSGAHVLEKDSWAAAVVDELVQAPWRTSRSTNTASAASGTRRWTVSCATSVSAQSCLRASTPINAFCIR